MERMSLKCWIDELNKGSWDSKSLETMCNAGWYDWFCKEKSLPARLAAMIPMVRAAAASPLIDSEKVYVFFKNNCPMNGRLYDSFSICELRSGDVLFWVTGKSGHTNEAEVVRRPDWEINCLPEGKRTKAGVRAFFACKL